MNDLKVIITGMPRCGKNIAMELAKANHDIIIANEVEKLEKAGVLNVEENVRMLVDAANKIPDSLRDLNNAMRQFNEAFDKMPKVIFNLKPIPQNEPSKYFSKPKNNFKRR